MILKKLTPELMVEDVNKTVDFYIQVLGFKLTNSVSEKKMLWAEVAWGESEVGLMFMEKNALGGDIKEFIDMNPGGSIVQFIEMNGIDELYGKVKDGVEIVQDIHETLYGTKEFAFKDINGYVLAFAERK